MTVEQLMKALSQFPKRAKVAILDHDQSGEVESGHLSWNGPVHAVGEAPEGVRERGYAVVIRG